MNKIFFFFGILVLSSIACIAQNKIDKATFEQLVNYSNCVYLMELIEKKDTGKPYIKNTYELKVKPILQNASLEDLNNVPTFDEIAILFPKGSNDIAQQFATKINDRKQKYDSSPDNNTLIESLGTTGWAGIDLTEVAINIQNSIKAKYNNNNVSKKSSEQEVVRAQTIQTSTQVGELQTKISEMQEHYNKLSDESQKDEKGSGVLIIWIIISLGLLIIVVAVHFFLSLIFYKNYKEYKREIKDQLVNKDIIINKIQNELGKPTRNEGSNSKKFDDKLHKLEKQLGEIQEKLTKSNITSQIWNKSTKAEDDKKILNYFRFFRSKLGKTLQEEVLNETEASFKIFDIDGNEAKFEYCGTVVNSDFFTDICTFENNPEDIPNKTRIQTTVPGIVKKENNDNWGVITPAKIRFI